MDTDFRNSLASSETSIPMGRMCTVCDPQIHVDPLVSMVYLYDNLVLPIQFGCFVGERDGRGVCGVSPTHPARGRADQRPGLVRAARVSLHV